MPKTISIVIPTLNEEKSIGRVLDAIPREKLKELGYNVEVLVVDGGSKDKTVEIALRKGARVIIVRRRGYGLAYIMGFKYTKGDIIVTLDADMTYPPMLIPYLVKILEQYSLDFITTNRFADFECDAFNRVRLLGNRLINLLVLFLFGLKLDDTQSGMWCFKKDILKRLNLGSWGMEFSTEIKIEAFKKTRAATVPIPYKKRIGQSKINYLRDGGRIVLFLIAKRLKMFFGY